MSTNSRVLLLFLIAAIPPTTTGPTAYGRGSQPPTTTVHRTRSGKCFHFPHCRVVAQYSTTTSTLKAARLADLQPCPFCNSPATHIHPTPRFPRPPKFDARLNGEPLASIRVDEAAGLVRIHPLLHGKTAASTITLSLSRETARILAVQLLAHSDPSELRFSNSK